MILTRPRRPPRRFAESARSRLARHPQDGLRVWGRFGRCVLCAHGFHPSFARDISERAMLDDGHEERYTVSGVIDAVGMRERHRNCHGDAHAWGVGGTLAPRGRGTAAGVRAVRRWRSRSPRRATRSVCGWRRSVGCRTLLRSCRREFGSSVPCPPLQVRPKPSAGPRNPSSSSLCHFS